MATNLVVNIVHYLRVSTTSTHRFSFTCGWNALGSVSELLAWVFGVVGIGTRHQALGRGNVLI